MNYRKALTVGLLGALAAVAQERFDAKVREDFFAGLAGNRGAMERGMKVCAETLAKNPKHAEALVWHGTGLYYMSRDFFMKGDSAKGIEMVTQGTKEMDDAVELAPKSLGTRIPRGAFFITGSRYAPPEYAKPMLEKGVGDFEIAYEIQKDQLDKLGEHPRGELLFGLADGYSRLGQQEKAETFFTIIQHDMKGTEYAKRAAIWLEKKSLPVEKTTCVGCHVK